MWTGALGPSAREIGVEVGFQFVEQHEVFVLAGLADGGDVGGIDDDCALFLQCVERLCHQCVYCVVEAKIFSYYADAGAAEAVGIEELRVISERLSGAGGGGAVFGINSGESTEQDRGVADGAAHGASAILRVGDGNDAAAADESDGGLDADGAVGGGRTDDGAVGFRADGEGAEICGDACAGAGAGAARIAVESVGIFGEAAAAAPSAGGMAGADIGPFAGIGFGENYGAGLAEFLRDERIFGGLRADEGQGAGGGAHAVVSINIIFDQDGDAVERAAGTFFFAFFVEGFGDGEGVGIGFDDAVDGGAVFVYGVYAG